jgi:hypothetical protein
VRYDPYDPYQPYHPALAGRRGSWWLVVLPLAVVVVLALGWAGLWYYAANTAEQTIAGWRAREAKTGRIYTCTNQTVSGFPFRIEVHCTDPGLELSAEQPPLSVKAKDLIIKAEIYDPTLLISEITGPVTVAENGQRPMIAADWALARTSVRGLPPTPEQVSIVFDKPTFLRAAGGGMETLVRAEHIELAARIASGSAAQNPVVELTVNLAKTTAPALSRYANQPVDADITATLYGLADLTPKPWPEKLRDLQAADGRLDITKARVAQSDVISSATGELALTPRGKLNGELHVTVANFEQAVVALGLDKTLTQTANSVSPGLSGRLSQFAPALGNLEKSSPGLANSLDRLVPGLGGIARGKPESGIATFISSLGTPTELEGKRAVTLPLRFNDGTVSIGPIPFGQTPPLF